MSSARSSSSPDRGRNAARAPRNAVQLCVGEDGYLVSCDDREVLAELRRWARPLRGRGTYSNRVELRAKDPKGPAIYWKGRLRHRVERKDDLLFAFEAWVYRRMPEPRIHAAALAFRGRVALFIGESGAGKSVLALTLVRRGWTYLSDEFAPLDREGRVLAVPRPVVFDAAELPPALGRRVRRGNESWTRRYTDHRGTPRKAIAVVPLRRARSGARHTIAAVFELTPRSGGPPRIRRLNSSATRALLFAARSLRGSRAVGRERHQARKGPPQPG